MLSAAIIVTIVACILSIEQTNGQFGFARPLVAGTIVGIVLGDPAMGVTLGAEMQLIFMGVTAIGAAVPPDYLIGTVVASAFAILSGQGVELALSLAVPVAIAGQSVNILGRTVNTVLIHWADKAAAKGDYKKIGTAHYLGALVTAARTALVVFPAIYFGVDAVEYMIGVVPAQLLTGLKVAGGILPVVGFAMLLKMLDIKKLLPFFFIGFALSTFGGFSMIGATMVAVCIAVLYDTLSNNKKLAPAAAANEKAKAEEDQLDTLMQ